MGAGTGPVPIAPLRRTNRLGLTRSSAAFLVFVFVIGFALRVAYFTWAPRDYAATKSDYDEIARNLVAGKGFSRAQTVHSSGESNALDDVKTVPVASRTPAYPLFLAAIYKTFGRRMKLVYLAQTLVDMLSALLLYALALKVTENGKVAALAALFYALYLPFMSQVAVLLNETLFGFFVVGFSVLAVWALATPSTLTFLTAGAALGLTSLCRPTTYLFPVLFLAAALLRYRKGLRQVLAPCAAFLAGFAVLIAPWMIRNYVVFGHFEFVGTLLGEQLYAANYEWGTPGQPFPMVPPQMRARLEGKSDRERNKILTREGFKEIVANPGRFAKNVALKTVKFWTAIGMGDPTFFYFSSGGSGRETSVFVAVVNIFLVAASVLTFIKFRGPWIHRALIPILLVGYVYIVHLPIIGVIRYSMPVIPFLMMFAAVGMVGLFAERKSGLC